MQVSLEARGLFSPCKCWWPGLQSFPLSGFQGSTSLFLEGGEQRARTLSSPALEAMWDMLCGGSSPTEHRIFGERPRTTSSPWSTFCIILGFVYGNGESGGQKTTAETLQSGFCGQGGGWEANAVSDPFVSLTVDEALNVCSHH